MLVEITKDKISVIFSESREKEKRLKKELEKVLAFKPDILWCG